METITREDILIEERIDLAGNDFASTLVVHNDDTNTFEWVIKSLVDICGCDHIQAEQLSLLVHYKGKASVKRGDHDLLNPLRRGLVDRGINATVE